MNPNKISFISAALNSLLVVVKLIIGLMSHSVALIAESIHSTVDVASSIITYLGIKAAAKPADKQHPYGHERYESIAGFLVVVLLFFSGFWVLSRTIPDLMKGKSHAEFNIFGVFVMVLSVSINLIMSRVKLKVGKKFSSVALVADARNSKADVISSGAVLIALILIKFYPLADSILASLVAFYIFYEAYHLGREMINSLLDTANPALEVKIKRMLHAKDMQFSGLKTRKMGNASVAEITLHFDPDLITSTVSPQIEKLEKDLVNQLDELRQIYIRVRPIEFTEELVRPKFGKRYRYLKTYSQ